MASTAAPGPLTETERFLFETSGYLVVPGALESGEVAACLAAARRAHETTGEKEWRQIGALYEREPAIEALMDHPSVFPKVRALLGSHFILQSSWCTLSPAGFPGGRWHQDGSSVYEFRRLGPPTPLVQLRVGFFLTDQREPDMGNMALIPGSHNARIGPPSAAGVTDISTAEVICGAPGAALLFHQGTWHCGVENARPHARYIQHMVYAPPWLRPSDRMGNDPEFLSRTTPLRRALCGEWSRPEEPFGVGYTPLPEDGP